jgi:serine phosphatase RsbU (regulator of sigma subunit)
MSIFYKILLTPLLGFLIFAIFLNYQQNLIYQNSKDIENIKDVIVPIIKITDNNIVTLGNINRHYEDMLVTLDKESISKIEVDKSKLLENLTILEKKFSYKNSINKKVIEYIDSSNRFIESFIKEQGFTEYNQKFMQKSISSLKTLKASLENLDKNIKQEFEKKLYNTNIALKNNLENAIIGFSISFFMILILVFNLASRVSHSIKSVSKSLDFTKNSEDILNLSLTKKSNDEIGDLIVSFNSSIGFLQELHQQVKSSINYASYIQDSLLPNHEVFDEAFNNNYFVIWTPRDTVGGDIYFMEKISDDEFLLMVIDCTGHGVPGAFVTMITKTITTEILANINSSKENVSPSQILSYFNIRMKKLLKQDTQDTKSNVGFDGGIVYINKKDKFMKFSGAETPLFIIQEEKLKTIKGDRHSIGYKKSKVDYEFKEHRIDILDNTKIYITTDGYLDQTGGEKNFCFGKKKFTSLITENTNKEFDIQSQLLMNTLISYQGNNDRKDDITVVGFKIN